MTRRQKSGSWWRSSDLRHRDADGTATWSLTTLRKALRSAPDGLPAVSTYTLWHVLHRAGYSHQLTRTWCPTGTAFRRRKSGAVVITDPDGNAQKKLIEDAYRLGEKLGLSVWCTDQAGPIPDGTPCRSGVCGRNANPHDNRTSISATVLLRY